MQILTDKEAMAWAILEAKKGRGWVAPNPVVGCCILDSSNRFLSVGAHLKFGEQHAETNALSKIHDKRLLKGAKVFVTLEPCAHVGNQPSCAHTLSQYDLGKVVYLVKDPNPKAQGGAEVLKQAGIVVEHMRELEDEGRVLAEVFLCNQIESRCLFHLKVASSLDGLVANASGESQWITNEESRAHVQVMRGEHDAVLVGRATFEQDSPRLNSRDVRFSGRSNWAIVLDPKAKLRDQLVDSSLTSVRPESKVVWVTSSSCQAKAPGSINHVQVPEMPGGELSLLELGKKLFQLGICSVMVEGGAKTFAAFFSQSMCDRLSVFQSASLIGSKNSPSWSSAFETRDLKARPTLRHLETTMFRDDIFVSGIIRNF
ncbi:MAG: bifunctional diaminohydroxyphosphoribosylaminopyrimidine deaminase/5-amino-6-(5-phosphoribosylamino)uracil reductase RibD [Bdellovibrionales bacterium]|nr:bifunctional diaminohydroxyphosphoribosylaminopyrimidine deaminase/5-amino-6-(5-phosphoribosylamino)uracil reductase RibD [Bdellovibrionales bacterium]